jgi:hypothetical protein
MIVVALLGTGCGRGVGLPSCETAPSNPDSATLLALQAVPTADYAPCLNSVKLGWDDVDYRFESGMVTIEIGRELSAFLEVRLTEKCDIGSAIPVPSGMPDVARYEAIDQVVSDIRVTIIPTGERPRIHALMMAKDLEGIRVEDRPVIFTVDEEIDFSVLTRVNDALFTNDYVWIIDDLDTEEDTLEMRRSANSDEGARGLSVEEALHRIEDMTPEVRYKGQWYLVFNGGCITYDFNAGGTVAETIADDVEDAIGLYPNGELREEGRRHGYELIDG